MMRWLGSFRTWDDAFLVFKSETAADRLAIEFTPHEIAVIDRVADGRDEFVWSPAHSELTENSRAYWAMM